MTRKWRPLEPLSREEMQMSAAQDTVFDFAVLSCLGFFSFVSTSVIFMNAAKIPKRSTPETNAPFFYQYLMHSKI
jgi:hypothetical protein